MKNIGYYWSLRPRIVRERDRHIVAGNVRHATSCPVALAISELKLPSFGHYSVLLGSFSWRVGRWIQNYDDDLPVGRLTFILMPWRSGPDVACTRRLSRQEFQAAALSLDQAKPPQTANDTAAYWHSKQVALSADNETLQELAQALRMESRDIRAQNTLLIEECQRRGAALVTIQDYGFNNSSHQEMKAVAVTCLAHTPHTLSQMLSKRPAKGI